VKQCLCTSFILDHELLISYFYKIILIILLYLKIGILLLLSWTGFKGASLQIRPVSAFLLRVIA